jgi:hypothetical protein
VGGEVEEKIKGDVRRKGILPLDRRTRVDSVGDVREESDRWGDRDRGRTRDDRGRVLCGR